VERLETHGIEHRFRETTSPLAKVARHPLQRRERAPPWGLGSGRLVRQGWLAKSLGADGRREKPTPWDPLGEFEGGLEVDGAWGCGPVLGAGRFGSIVSLLLLVCL
jgi:hypothetical protein